MQPKHTNAATEDMPKKHKLCIGGSAGGKLRMVSIVRGTRTPQGAEVILVYDFIRVVYDKSEAEARQMWRDLIENMRDGTYRGLGFLFYEVTLPDMTVEVWALAMTAQGLQRLQVVLGLEVAERF
jgi:hypothetical protein